MCSGTPPTGSSGSVNRVTTRHTVQYVYSWTLVTLIRNLFHKSPGELKLAPHCFVRKSPSSIIWSFDQKIWETALLHQIGLERSRWLWYNILLVSYRHPPISDQGDYSQQFSESFNKTIHKLFIQSCFSISVSRGSFYTEWLSSSFIFLQSLQMCHLPVHLLSPSRAQTDAASEQWSYRRWRCPLSTLGGTAVRHKNGGDDTDSSYYSNNM